jgi:Asp-tRNA(Asn)/Glu-tRNA(Gln) amidotransferase A subunit family amidase
LPVGININGDYRKDQEVLEFSEALEKEIKQQL